VKRYAAMIASLVLAPPGLDAQQYRPDQPEVLQPDRSVHAQRPARPGPDLASVRANYVASDRPLVLILAGRTLGSQTSEWSADTRDVTSNLQQSFQGPSSSTTRQTGTRQTDTRNPIAVNVTPALEAFMRGVERLLGQVAIRTLHYDTALRRAQQENELGGRLSREGDLRKNEADAVLAYAHLMLELNTQATSSVHGVPVETFSARLTRVDNAAVLARRSTRPEQAVEVTEQWDAGSSGYQKTRNVVHRYEDLGFETAHRLFAEALRSPIHVIAGGDRKAPLPPPANPANARKPVLKKNR